MTAGALAAEIALSRPDGVTISGGEPFLQAAALAEMLRILRLDFGYDTGVIVYTGFLLEELQQIPAMKPLLEQTDLLIDGPYVRELDDGRSLRGSSNQRIIPLTNRYNRPEILSLYGAEGRRTEYFWHGGSINCVGVDNHADSLDKGRQALSSDINNKPSTI
jgi:anaerobic ribonucleoside-triphosphate reductase activating protein